MSGFFGKLVMIAMVIAVAWYGWRWWQRSIGADKPAPAPKPQPPQAPPAAARGSAAQTGRPAIEDLVACRVCGAYVQAGTVHCDRPAS